jgi:hypothetical protein
MNRPSESEIHSILQQLLQSPEFHDSVRYQELLQYLADKSLKVTSLKETEIAHDVFGKNASFDPAADPLIRSYISNLRKKLEHYYLTTENQFDYKLEIPKGQYLVKYTKVSKNILPKKIRNYLPMAYLATIVILVGVVILQAVLNNSALTSDANTAVVNPIWNEFIENNQHPTLIVLGDFLVLSEKGKMEGRTFLRDPKINSEKELRDLTFKNKDNYAKYQIADVSYIGIAPALGLSDITKIIKNSTKQFSVKLSSQLKWDDFDNNNIVYLGTLKTLAKLDTLFSRTNLKYSLSPNSLTIRDTQNDSSRTLKLNWHGGNYQKDYSIILKLLGSKNNSIVFLTGFSEVGVMESIKAATDTNLVSRIKAFSDAVVPNDQFLFEMISETEGLGHTVFRSEIKYFSPLKNTLLK